MAAGASTYPQTLDDYTERPESGEIQSKDVNDLQAAIEEVEKEAGVRDTSNTWTLHYRLRNVNSANPGHKHTSSETTHDIMSTIHQDTDTTALPVRGDLMAHDGNKWGRIPKGSADQVLTMDALGNDPGWAAAAAAGSKYYTLFSTVFEDLARFDNFGTNDCATVIGVSGLRIDCEAAQNAGRKLFIRSNFITSTNDGILTASWFPNGGTGSLDESYFGLSGGDSITWGDGGGTYTSQDQFGIKNIGDGTNIDISATNSDNVTETATVILANEASGARQQVQMELLGGTNIKWYDVEGTALATHTANLPTA